MLHIRDAAVTDTNDLYSIDLKSFETPWQADIWGRTVVSHAHNTRVITDNGNVLGFAVYHLDKSGVLEVDKLAIKPSARRLGHSFHLMANIIDTAQRANATTISMVIPQSLVFDDGVGVWAKKIGFRAVTPILTGHFNGEDGIRFVAHAN